MRAILCVLLAAALCAQAPPQATPEHLAAMKKLSFLVGEWRGDAWTQMGPEKHTSTGTEIVQFKLNDTSITVDGAFKDAAGQSVHNAFGVFSYNPRTSSYRFHAFTGNGQMVEAKVEMKDSGLDWSFEPAPGIAIRYQLRISDKGQWVEKGEMTREGATRQFFEMRLEKVK